MIKSQVIDFASEFKSLGFPDPKALASLQDVARFKTSGGAENAADGIWFKSCGS
jgi:hypothetical protein